MDLKQYISEKREIVNREIERILSTGQEHPLSGIYSYCLSSGKRFRPILVMAAAEACGLKGEKVLPAAVAVEMIHNFSLVHDDLPCMDNDLERRGMPTCHAKYGEADALLAGDGLLIYAFEILVANAEIEGVRSGDVLNVAGLFSKSAGHQGMTGGQVLDMKYQSADEIEPQMLKRIHACKTGALITASVSAGAILAGADKRRLDALMEYGRCVGLTYQIVDDLLDIDTDPGAISFPAVFGMDEAKRMAAEATQTALKSLDVFDHRAEPLRLLADYLLKRKR